MIRILTLVLSIETQIIRIEFLHNFDYQNVVYIDVSIIVYLCKRVRCEDAVKMMSINCDTHIISNNNICKFPRVFFLKKLTFLSTSSPGSDRMVVSAFPIVLILRNGNV